MKNSQRLKIATAKIGEALEYLTGIIHGGELERINQTIATIKIERKKKFSGMLKADDTFDAGFDSGTQLALDLLGEWKEHLREEEGDES